LLCGCRASARQYRGGGSLPPGSSGFPGSSAAVAGVGGNGEGMWRGAGPRTPRRGAGLRFLCRRGDGIDRAMPMFSPGPRRVAVLGPTNTGKTHLAIERMLGYRSGMIGFPLRLLARENYDRIVKLRGARAVALITGEEKILPPNPSYFVCTVESMPLERQVDFLA